MVKDRIFRKTKYIFFVLKDGFLVARTLLVSKQQSNLLGDAGSSTKRNRRSHLRDDFIAIAERTENRANNRTSKGAICNKKRTRLPEHLRDLSVFYDAHLLVYGRGAPFLALPRATRWSAAKGWALRLKPDGIYVIVNQRPRFSPLMGPLLPTLHLA